MLQTKKLLLEFQKIKLKQYFNYQCISGTCRHILYNISHVTDDQFGAVSDGLQ